MQFDGCACSGGSLDRLLRPCVMAVLARYPEGLHGYVVAQELQEIAIFGEGPPDMTGLYRVLRAMEVEGYLAASWDVEGSGPARRMYALTEAGRDCLQRWTVTLDGYLRELQGTVKYIKQSLQPPAEPVKR